MYRLERKSRDHDSPSFSSTLLDQIYRSIDEEETKSSETNFYKQQQQQRQTTTAFNKQTDANHNNIPRSEQKILAVIGNRKSRRQQYHDRDVHFFSSTSISSDSCSSGFSSSDTDSLSRASCFASQWAKPVRTSASFRFEKEKQATRVFDGFYYAKQSTEIRGEEALLIKNKSRALKIYNNLKKVKQPISPGGKLTSFLNSLFATTGTGNNNVKKKKSKGTCEDNVEERKVTCSSTRSCLSKTTSSHGLRNGVNKTVRFVPVEEKESRVVITEAARKFLKEYRSNYKKKELPTNHYDDDDDDDVASCASSDLFELDHLDVLGDSSRYCEDLPVYETTRISTNRAIANGLIV